MVGSFSAMGKRIVAERLVVASAIGFVKHPPVRDQKGPEVLCDLTD